MGRGEAKFLTVAALYERRLRTFGGHRPPLQGKAFAHDLCRLLDVLSRVRGGKEAGFELGGGEVHPAIETSLEEARELFGVAPLGAGEIGHGLVGKKEAEHRADRKSTRLNSSHIPL